MKKINFWKSLFLVIGCFYESLGFSQDQVLQQNVDSQLLKGETILNSNIAPKVIPKHTVCSGPNVIAGSDIFDGDEHINWPEMTRDNIKFVFIKATQGTTFVNKLYQQQRDNAKDQNIVFAPYHFLNPADDPYLQAKFFLETVGEFDKTQLPPMLDWEISEFKSKEVQIRAAKIWLEEVEKATGAKPIIYVAPGFFDQFGKTDIFKDYPLFVAHYGKTCPTVPTGWSNWQFWQKGIGRIKGIEHHKADLDVFNGSEQDLQNFIKKAWTPTP